MCYWCKNRHLDKWNLDKWTEDFPNGPVVRTPCFQCRDYGFRSLLSSGVAKKKDKWRIESHAVNPHIYGQLIFDKGRKIIQWRKNTSLFNNCMSTCKRNMKLDLSYHTTRWIQAESKLDGLGIPNARTKTEEKNKTNVVI